MPISIDPFEEELASLKKTCEYGTFEYADSSILFATVANSHFRGNQLQKRRGIYIVRQRETREVLYIGKGGTVDAQGRFKGQDIPGRLKNVKGNGVSANEWFRSLSEEKGPLAIEYIRLAATPRSPALIEAVLLQAYLNEHGHLPHRNKSL